MTGFGAGTGAGLAFAACDAAFADSKKKAEPKE
jgi:hypothetical protein